VKGKANTCRKKIRVKNMNELTICNETDDITIMNGDGREIMVNSKGKWFIVNADGTRTSMNELVSMMEEISEKIGRMADALRTLEGISVDVSEGK